jgi:hypothetical protein
MRTAEIFIPPLLVQWATGHVNRDARRSAVKIERLCCDLVRPGLGFEPDPAVIAKDRNG